MVCFNCVVKVENEIEKHNCIWRPPSLSKLTPVVFNTGLTHLGSDASKYIINVSQNENH